MMTTDVGGEEEVSVDLFFREVADMPSVERKAVELARGRVLDLGAGAGAHSVPLSQAGLATTAVEVLPTAREILMERGIPDVRVGGLESLDAGERFDTVLVLMNGLGLAGSLDGLGQFLAELAEQVESGGQILADSTDPRSWGESGDGRYPGEVHMQLAFDGDEGPPFPFLFVDPDTLRDVAGSAGLDTEVVAVDEHGRYLARLRVR
jgi:SAM-dependent methyltransferase